MKHSVIIPHRGREAHLAACLWFLRRSADETGCRDWETIFVDSDPAAPFNKPAALNRGLDEARGEVVTVLDCDALVGRLFLTAIAPLEDSCLMRVAYRVRYLPEHFIRAGMLSPLDILRQFGSYNSGGFLLAWEAYRFPDRDRHEPQEQPWGNSQFSMRRADLEGLRFDEQFVGKGWEDIDFNRQVWRKFRGSFRGHIWTDGDHAMFHMQHAYEPEWGGEGARMRNLAYYKHKYLVECAKEN